MSSRHATHDGVGLDSLATAEGLDSGVSKDPSGDGDVRRLREAAVGPQPS